MAYVDAIVTLKALIDTITIPPEAGGPAVPKVVVVGWLPFSVERNTSGQMKPYFTLIRSSLPAQPLDSSGDTEEYFDTVQVDLWCTDYGTHEPANNLMEKMLVQLRALIKTNKAAPNASARYMRIVSETPKDEPDKSPPIKRTMVLVELHGFR